MKRELKKSRVLKGGTAISPEISSAHGLQRREAIRQTDRNDCKEGREWEDPDYKYLYRRDGGGRGGREQTDFRGSSRRSALSYISRLLRRLSRCWGADERICSLVCV